MQFVAKILPNNRLVPPSTVDTPLEILDPPLWTLLSEVTNFPKLRGKDAQNESRNLVRFDYLKPILC